jgi:hypothetical protein
LRRLTSFQTICEDARPEELVMGGVQGMGSGCSYQFEIGGIIRFDFSRIGNSQQILTLCEFITRKKFRIFTNS